MLPKVLADVIDISSDKARSNDSLVVDTNVWLFVAYTRLGSGGKGNSNSKVSIYSNYLLGARTAGSQLNHCGLTLAIALSISVSNSMRMALPGTFIL